MRHFGRHNERHPPQLNAPCELSCPLAPLLAQHPAHERLFFFPARSHVRACASLPHGPGTIHASCPALKPAPSCQHSNLSSRCAPRRADLRHVCTLPFSFGALPESPPSVLRLFAHHSFYGPPRPAVYDAHSFLPAAPAARVLCFRCLSPAHMWAMLPYWPRLLPGPTHASRPARMRHSLQAFLHLLTCSERMINVLMLDSMISRAG